MNRGSIWRKWDLHFHTPSSYDYDHKAVTNEEIVEVLKNNNVSAIAITDHHLIDITRIQELKSLAGNDILIFPGIELRSELGGSESIHFIGIFPDDSDLSTINTKLSGNLNITPKDVEDKGNDNIYCDFKEAAYLIHDLCGIVSIHAGKKSNTIERITNALSYKQAQKKDLLEHIDIFEMGSKNDCESYRVNVFPHIGKHPPMVLCSDNHDIRKYPDKEPCWIKADLTFEGLKQILFEPDYRVAISTENPEHRKNIYSFDNIEINNSKVNQDLEITQQRIDFTPSLAAITGGKGSGKTALLDLLGNCYIDRTKSGGVDKNSFIQRIQDECPDLEVSIGFIGEDLQDFSKSIDDGNFVEESKITYLPQGKIEEFSGDRTKLDLKIQEIIFCNEDVMGSNYKAKFDLLENNIKEISNDIAELNHNIYKIEQETSSQVLRMLLDSKAIKEGILKDKSAELKEFSAKLDEAKKEQIETAKKAELDIKEKLGEFKNVTDKLLELEKKLEEISEDQNAKITVINNNLSKIPGCEAIKEVTFDSQLKSIKNNLGNIKKEDKNLRGKLAEKKEILDQFSGDEKIHAKLLTEISSIESEIKEIDQKCAEIDSKKRELDSLKLGRLKKYRRLLYKYWIWSDYYKDIIKIFSKDKSDIMSGIEFEARIFFDKDSFTNKCNEVFDLRILKSDQIEKWAALIEEAIAQPKIANMLRILNKYLKDINKRSSDIKASRNKYDIYNLVYNNYFTLSTNIYFSGISIERLSIGQKGTVLLKLFLAEGDYPLIIDQPEESLDNKFVYSELVRAIRQAKTRRQIIIATNNANLVVNTDAEQVITSKFENNIITYESGTLEDLEMRKDLLPFLEGGKEAFKKREEKYGI